MRLYNEFAAWWPLLSPPGHYVEEAADLVARIRTAQDGPAETLLELGCGGGSLAFHLKRHFRPTLTDLAPRMVAVSRTVNPECDHVVGDMRTLRLRRTFDVVLIHDAICYMTTSADVQAALATAAAHCRPGGVVAVLPDHVRETFQPGTECGGEDAPDGRGLRYLEWTWDPDPADETCIVDYSYTFRSVEGVVTVDHDRHIEGLFSRDQWHEWLDAAGIRATGATDAWGREVFIGPLDCHEPRRLA